MKNQSNHGLDQKCIGSGTNRQVNIGYGRSLTFSGVHHQKKTLGVFAEPLKHFAGLGHLVAHHSVPAPSHQHFSSVLVRYGHIVLLSQHPAKHPP